MYKFVIVAGKLRGEEFSLSEGDNTVGRDSTCDIQIPIDGISKTHLTVSVRNDSIYLQDMDSSNGTFLNGKMIKRATAQNGDKITLPDAILQVVYVQEKKIIIEKEIDVEKEVDSEEMLQGGHVPDGIPDKVVYYFKYKLMNLFYGINKEYEWKILFAIVLTLFVIATITITILPIQHDSEILLLKETAKRGAHFADEIARLNFQALEAKDIDSLDTAFLEREPGVESYELFDIDGRIVRPVGKLNEIITTPFSINAKQWAENENNIGTLKKMLSDGKIGIAQKIMAYNPKIGDSQAVGIIAIKFAPRSLATVAIENRAAYLRAVTVSIMIAIFFFGVVYFLTLRPLEEMNFQIEDALKGKRGSIETGYMMSELIPLRKSINTLLQRIRELQQDESEGDFESHESDQPYIDIMTELMSGSGVPTLLLDSEKNVQKINDTAEDLLGIREAASQGANFLDVAREQGLSATIIELCDASAENNGAHQQNEYTLQGNEYVINVASMIGQDKFAKAYYITFTKDL